MIKPRMERFVLGPLVRVRLPSPQGISSTAITPRRRQVTRRMAFHGRNPPGESRPSTRGNKLGRFPRGLGSPAETVRFNDALPSLPGKRINLLYTGVPKDHRRFLRVEREGNPGEVTGESKTAQAGHHLHAL